MLKTPKRYICVCLVLVALVPLAWLSFPNGIDPARAAMAEYRIEKMTCSSCVGNIEKALTGLDGVGSVEVNLTSGRGRVTYDVAKIDSRSIADAITAAGYPAQLRLGLDPQAYAELQREQSQLGQQYLARIGDRLLARSEFELLVRQRAGGAAPGREDDQLWRTVWQDTLKREMMLADAERNKVVIQHGEVDARLEQLRREHQGLDQLVAERYGTLDAFRRRLRDDMIIERNIEDHVCAGVDDPGARQARLQSWFSGLQKETDVVIFDPRLKALAQGGSGCACCNG